MFHLIISNLTGANQSPPTLIIMKWKHPFNYTLIPICGQVSQVWLSRPSNIPDSSVQEFCQHHHCECRDHSSGYVEVLQNNTKFKRGWEPQASSARWASCWWQPELRSAEIHVTVTEVTGNMDFMWSLQKDSVFLQSLFCAVKRLSKGRNNLPGAMLPTPVQIWQKKAMRRESLSCWAAGIQREWLGRIFYTAQGDAAGLEKD